MKINLNTPLIHFDGKPIENQNGSMTAATAIIDALMGMYKDEDNLPAMKKVMRHTLAVKIYEAKEKPPVEVSIEELSEIKTLVGKFYGPAVVGPVYKILEERATNATE